MKIVYCIHSTHNSGGMERTVINKANYLAELGYEIFLVTTEQRNQLPFFEISQSIKCVNLDINYSSDNTKNVFLKGYSFLKKRKIHEILLTKLLFQIRPDITISTFGNEVSFLFSIKDGSKKIVEIHFSKFFRLQYDRKGLWKLVDFYRSWNDKKVAAGYDKFIVLTKEDKDHWGKLSNIEVIPNFVNTPINKSNVQNKVCIAVGRLSYQKNFECLLDIWKVVTAKYPDWNLHIYGSGEGRDTLLHKIELLNLGDTVTIYEPTSHIEEAYLQSSIYLLTSRYEGLPMVLLEAMSNGIPPIAFACKCGPRDLIKNNVNGFIIEENDIDDFSKKLMLLMSNSDLRIAMGKQARLDVQNYSKETIMQKWSTLFMSLSE